jgi:hypothetical protein
VRFIPIVACGAFVACSSGQGSTSPGTPPRRGATPASFELPTPVGWKTETIPFPLDFAPSLSYRGTEELRFAPGFFKQGAEGFWSYAFVWYLEGDVPFTAAVLAQNLETYFNGLAKAVEKPGVYDATTAAVHARFEEDKQGNRGSTHYEGTVDTYDAFATHARVTLHARVDVLRCATEGRTAVLFRASPQPPDHALWGELERITSGFQCSRGE